MPESDAYTIRPAQSSDAAFLVELHELPHAREYFAVPQVEQVERRIEGSDTEHWIVLKDDECVGMVGFGEVTPWLFEIRIMLSKRQGRGVGSFAFEATLERIFEHHRAHRAYLEVHARNTIARRLYERCGFTQEGIFRHGARNPETGAFEDLCAYGMLEDEYRSRRG